MRYIPLGTPAFGEQRSLRGNRSLTERLLFYVMGVADPAHYLHHRILRACLDTASPLEPRRILDAGSGPGDHSFYLARRFPNAQVLGIDVDSRRVESSREAARELGLSNVWFDVADCASASAAWCREPFDLIISIDVLEHIPDQERALSNLVAMLSPGGVMIVHIPTSRPRPVPFGRWLTGFHAWAEEEHVAEERTAAEFLRMVAGSGLEIRRALPTFGYWTGEMATSLFALPFRSSLRNRVLQALLAPLCRLLVLADRFELEKQRYALAVVARQRGLVQ